MSRKSSGFGVSTPRVLEFRRPPRDCEVLKDTLSSPSPINGSMYWLKRAEQDTDRFQKAMSYKNEARQKRDYAMSEMEEKLNDQIERELISLSPRSSRNLGESTNMSDTSSLDLSQALFEEDIATPLQKAHTLLQLIKMRQNTETKENHKGVVHFYPFTATERFKLNGRDYAIKQFRAQNNFTIPRRETQYLSPLGLPFATGGNLQGGRSSNLRFEYPKTVDSSVSQPSPPRSPLKLEEQQKINGMQSNLPLSAGAGTFIGWHPPKTDQQISIFKKSMAWASATDVESLCRQQLNHHRVFPSTSWRGGPGVGPTNRSLHGSLRGQLRESQADGVDFCMTTAGPTSCWQNRVKTSRIVGDGVKIPFSFEPQECYSPLSSPRR